MNESALESSALQEPFLQHGEGMRNKWKKTALTLPRTLSVFHAVPVIPHSLLIFSVTSIFLYTSERETLFKDAIAECSGRPEISKTTGL